MALLYNTSTRVTLASRGNSASKKIQVLEVLSLQDSLHHSTLRVLGDVIAKILPYVRFPMDAPTQTKFQQPSIFFFQEIDPVNCRAHGNDLYGYGGWVQKYGTLSPLKYIYSNPCRFPISSLGLPNIPSQEGWEGALAKYTANGWTSTRQILESYNHFFLIKYFITKAIYSFLHSLLVYYTNPWSALLLEHTSLL